MLLNEIRELTMTDISCELLLYRSADLGIEMSRKVCDAAHRLIDEIVICSVHLWVILSSYCYVWYYQTSYSWKCVCAYVCVCVWD